MTGNAIRVACEELMKELRKPDGSCMTYAEATAAGKPLKYVGKFSVPGTACDDKGQGRPFVVYMYGVFLAEVSVNTETGKVTVDKMTLMADIGKVNNRLVTDGQIYGGMAQGVGLALTEDFEDLKKHSTLIGAGFPFATDIPDNMEIVYFENYPREFGPLRLRRSGGASPFQPPCGHRQRHLSCLRRAGASSSRPAGEDSRRSQGRSGIAL